MVRSCRQPPRPTTEDDCQDSGVNICSSVCIKYEEYVISAAETSEWSSGLGDSRMGGNSARRNPRVLHRARKRKPRGHSGENLTSPNSPNQFHAAAQNLFRFIFHHIIIISHRTSTPTYKQVRRPVSGFGCSLRCCTPLHCKQRIHLPTRRDPPSARFSKRREWVIRRKMYAQTLLNLGLVSKDSLLLLLEHKQSFTTNQLFNLIIFSQSV